MKKPRFNHMEKKQFDLHVKFTEDDMERLRVLALNARVSISGYIRQVINQKYKEFIKI